MGRRTAAALAALMLAAAGSAPAQAPAANAWVQAVPSGRELRATAPGGACPAAVVDGTSRPMRQRAAADAAFPVICALPLAPTDHKIEVEGVQIAQPPAVPQRIVVLGDTGCRIKGAKVQACDDPKAWPWRQVAALAAARRPDLIVHVGDYLYRESPCPTGDVHCAGTPHGDTWDAWSADFFEPAGPLLAAAPWVFVRGNHESCKRAGRGWFRLLDAAPEPPACPAERSAPFAVDLGGLSLVVLDSADTDDREIKNDKAFRADFEQGLKLAPTEGPLWVVTHRPVWGVTPAKAKVGPFGPIDVEVGLNRSEQVALHGEDLKRVDLFVAGHIHEFESLDFGPSRPPQLVVGTGGDVAEDGATPKIQEKTFGLDGMDAQMLEFARFGYLVLDRTREGWDGAFYDAQDRLTATCKIASRRLACEPVTKPAHP